MSEADQWTGLTFRPARPEDKPRMLEITARTWDDGDYISEVWDRWLADPHGEFTAVESGGIVVALAKLTYQGEGQWWQEGLRVDPEHRLTGIGQAMSTYQVKLVKRLGGRVIRHATGIDNEGSHRIAERAGFHVLARFVERVAEKLDGPVEAEALTSADLDAVWTHGVARDSDVIGASHGIYVYDWMAFEMSRECLAEHLGKGQVMGVRDNAGHVRAWCLVAPDPGWDRLGITCLEGTLEGITALAHAMRAQASAFGKAMAQAWTPPHPRVLDALVAAGYRLEASQDQDTNEHGLDILELRLDGA